MKGSWTNQIRRWMERQRFFPGPGGFLVNPFYLARSGLLGGIRPFLPHLTGVVLDAGCGTKPYRSLIPADRYIGMEVDTPRTRQSFMADIYYDGRHFPLETESVDSVICSQVLEHVFAPKEFLCEIHRVLRPGGCLLLTVPFVWDEHEQPHDFARYSSFGLAALVEGAGLVVQARRKTAGDGRVLFQLINVYLHKVTLTRWPRLNLLSALLLMAPVNLMGILVGRLLPVNDDLYLDNILFARKPSRPPR